MDFKGYFMKGVEMVKLNRDAAGEVAADEGSFGPAVLFFAIGGLAAGIGHALGSFGLGSGMILVGPVLHVLGSFISVGILHLVALLLGGKGEFRGYYSALGVGSLPVWARVVPYLGGLVSLWNIPVTVIVTERAHNLSTARAIAVVMIPVAVLILIMFVLIAIIGMAAFTSMMNMGHMQTI